MFCPARCACWMRNEQGTLAGDLVEFSSAGWVCGFNLMFIQLTEVVFFPGGRPGIDDVLPAGCS